MRNLQQQSNPSDGDVQLDSIIDKPGGTIRDRRVASGFDVVQCAFVPAVDISLPGEEPFRLVFRSMKPYNSSKGVTRAFCRVCGAVIFFSDDSRPYLFEVAVGLLRASRGPRAEELLEWETGRVSFEEEALNKLLVDGLRNGLRSWGEFKSR